jgi:hypothetical protein
LPEVFFFSLPDFGIAESHERTSANPIGVYDCQQIHYLSQISLTKCWHDIWFKPSGIVFLLIALQDK